MKDSTVVIIPALNAASTLPRQLAALDSQTDLDFHVVVSDNGSTDETTRLCEDWQPRFGGLTVLDSSHKPGAAAARNLGIANTNDLNILFCDADDRVHPTWVAAMKSALKQFDGVTGPLRLIHEHAHGPYATWNATSVPVSQGFREYLPSCNCGVRRALAEGVQGFEEELALAQEDVDFGWRAIAAGYRLGHSPDAIIDYYQRLGTRAFVLQQYRQGRAYVQLFVRHRSEGPRPASWRSSARWFIHWARQLPRKAREGELRASLGAAAFQTGRVQESIRRRTRAPL